MMNDDEPSVRRPAWVCGASFAAIAIVFLNADAPVSLKFESGPANTIFFTLALVVLPVAAGWAARRIAPGPGGGAVMAGFLAAPVFLIGLVGCIAELPPALRGEENLGDRVAEARAGRYRIATYHTLGPPYSASGILLRQERVLVPGVMLARRLYSTSRVNATYTHIHVDSPDRVRITSPGFKPPLTHSYRLRSFPFGL